MMSLKLCAVKRFCAFAADELSLVIRKLLVIAAEDTAGLVLLKHDAVSVNKYLHRILGAELKCFSDLDGENYSAEIVNGANYTC